MGIEPNDELKLEIKNLIMLTLNITDVDPTEVDDDEPLFGSKNALTLDSVDGIEIIMALQRKYNVRINDQNLARHIIQSINSIAEFITREKTTS
ncbi:MAG: acyl carrier protein [Bacteroidales bacterium]|nr:acyl carrier protein [Bacteroidales bacterium]